MTPSEAARLLEVPADATPEQLEARFLELRRKLEDKIAKAPTPGLQAKYRESLTEITTAFETLTLVADSSALPVLQKQSAKGEAPSDGGRKTEAGGQTPGAGAPPPREPRSQTPASKTPVRKSGGREFALVAMIAVVVLAAGGWFVMKTRAANAEKARQTADLHSRLAEAGVVWEAAENELRDSERQLDRLRSELRDSRDLPAARRTGLEAEIDSHAQHSDWLRQLLAQHPLKLSRARLESQLAAGSIDSALVEAGKLPAAVESLQADLAANHGAVTTVELRIPLPDARWKITASDGSVREGTGSANIPSLPFGRHGLLVTRPPLATVQGQLVLTPGKHVPSEIPMPHATLTLPTMPAGAVVRSRGQVVAPLPDGGYPVLPGASKLQINHRDFLPIEVEVTMVADARAAKTDLIWTSSRSGQELFQAYLASIRRNDDYFEQLQAGMDVGRRAGLFTPAQAAELYREALRTAQKQTDTAARLSDQISVCDVLRFHDPDLTRRTLEAVAGELIALPAEEIAKGFGAVSSPAWRLVPETGLRLLAACEEALLKAGRHKHTFTSLARGYISLGRLDLAEQWRQRAVAGRSDITGLEADLTDTLKSNRPPNPIEDRWLAATETQDKAAIEALAREMTAMTEGGMPPDQIPWRTIADAYFTLGYDRGWLAFIGQSNWYLPDGRAERVGRFDLWEKQLRQFRGSKTYIPSQLMDLALGWAARGNAGQARRIAGPLEESTDNQVIARRALLEAMLGQEEAARGLLDQLEKANALGKANSNRWSSRDYMSAAAQLLGDRDRVMHYDEGFDPSAPGLISAKLLAMIGRYDEAEAAIGKEVGSSDSFRAMESSHLLWRFLRPGNPLIDLVPSHYGREQLPLVLLRLQSGRSPRSDEAVAVPLLRMPPHRITRTPFNFPAAARNQGLTEGRVKLRVQVLADGAVGEIETLSATDPIFAETFAAAVKQDTFAPSLVRGEPADGWIELSATFK